MRFAQVIGLSVLSAASAFAQAPTDFCVSEGGRWCEFIATGMYVQDTVPPGTQYWVIHGAPQVAKRQLGVLRSKITKTPPGVSPPPLPEIPAGSYVIAVVSGWKKVSSNPRVKLWPPFYCSGTTDVSQLPNEDIDYWVSVCRGNSSGLQGKVALFGTIRLNEQEISDQALDPDDDPECAAGAETAPPARSGRLRPQDTGCRRTWLFVKVNRYPSLPSNFSGSRRQNVRVFMHTADSKGGFRPAEAVKGTPP